tara:strand:+ start:791 stop:913 length:123 start_codon:yes stop_codon:yes gene_type:complete
MSSVGFYPVLLQLMDLGLDEVMRANCTDEDADLNPHAAIF